MLWKPPKLDNKVKNGNKVEFGNKEQNRSTEGCSKLKRCVDMTSLGKNGLNIRTNKFANWCNVLSIEGVTVYGQSQNVM